MNDNQAVCTQCGVKTGGGNKYCQNCGKELPANADVCMNCGVAVNKAAPISLDGNLGGQSKLVMALICFFLGGIGIHNYIMSKTKKGVFKIVMCFCFGISAILALIDFVKILTDKYVIDPTKLI